MGFEYASCPVTRSELSPTHCEQRGYCGPFVNRHRYDLFPDPAWHGMAECLECGGTVLAATHEARLRNLLLLTPSSLG